MIGLKGVSRDWAPGGLVRVAGSFTIVASAIAASQPKVQGYTMVRKAAGVYLLTMTQAFNKVVSAVAHIGPDKTITTTALPTVPPAVAMISQDFISASATNYVVDTTNTKMVITVTNVAGNALADVPANYRLGFQILFSDTVIN